MSSCKKIGGLALAILFLVVVARRIPTVAGLAAAAWDQAGPSGSERGAIWDPIRLSSLAADVDDMPLIGQVGGVTLGVAVQGSTIYAGAGQRLRVLDVSDPTDPTVASETSPLNGIVEDVALAASYAYLALGDSGLRIVSISDPGHLQPVGHLDLAGYAIDVFISGNYAYVACGDVGVKVVSVADPSDPQLVGTYNSPGWAVDVFVSGSYAYIADQDRGLRVVSLSDPAYPAEVGAFDTGDRAEGVFVQGAYAYVADGEDGLRVIAISDPANPTEVGAYDAPGYARDVFVAGSYAYLADRLSGLRIVSVAEPENPVALAVISTLGEADDVVVSGSHAYLADGARGLQVISVSDKANPRRVGVHEKLGESQDLVVSGSYAYAAGEAGLWILSVSDPSNPQVLSRYQAPEGLTGVFVSDSYAYVTAWQSGLRIVSVADPTHPEEVASLDTPGLAAHVVVSDDHAYVADWLEGVRVISVHDPLNPTEVGVCDTPGAARQVAVSGNYAYVADQAGGGLRILSIADPSDPTEVGSLDTPGQAQGVFVSGSYAYVADGWSGLRIISVADPTYPREVGFFPTGYARSGEVAGSYAYLAVSSRGFDVISVVDPTNPQGIETVDTPGYTLDVVPICRHVYVSDGLNGLLVMQPATSPICEPRIAVSKEASQTIVRTGRTVTYTYTVTNPGDDVLSNVRLSDDKCGPLTFVGGDVNGDARLDLAETWTYGCSQALDASTTNRATVTGTSSAGDTVSDQDVATVEVVTYDPPVVNLGSTTYSVQERAGLATIVARLGAPSSHQVTVDYATSDGTATAGSDYVAASGVLSFASGTTQRSFAISITDDALMEGDETVLLTLSNASNAYIGDVRAATLTIRDDDSPKTNFVHLPVLLRDVPRYAHPCDIANGYCENNDLPREAYGPLEPGVAYRAYPEDGDDYYYFVLSEAGTVTIEVSGYAPTSKYGTVVLYGPGAGDEIGPQIDYYGRPGDTSMSLGPHTLGPGKYTIWVYTVAGHYRSDALYTLMVAS